MCFASPSSDWTLSAYKVLDRIGERDGAMSATRTFEALEPEPDASSSSRILGAHRPARGIFR
jgi:hypothetical protein